MEDGKREEPSGRFESSMAGEPTIYTEVCVRRTYSFCLLLRYLNSVCMLELVRDECWFVLRLKKEKGKMYMFLLKLHRRGCEKMFIYRRKTSFLLCNR